MASNTEQFEIGDWVHVKSYDKYGTFIEITDDGKEAIIELKDNDDCDGEWPYGILFTTPDDIEKVK